MASINKESSGRWRARYRDRNGGQHSRRFSRKVDAQRWIDDVTTELTTGSWTDPRRSRLPVVEWVQQWFEGKVDLAETSRARLRGIVRGQIVEKWAGVALIDLEHAKVQQWVSELTESGLSPRSVKKVVGVLSSACDAAVRDRRIAVNPCAGVVFPRPGPSDKVFLTPEQVEELAGESGRRGSLIVYTLAYCGLRWGELAGLRVEDIDTLRRRLKIRQTIVDVDGKLVVKPPKDFEVRSVPVPRFLIEQLVEHIAGRPREALVFTSAKGQALRNNNERRRWFDQAAGAIGEPDLTPHGLRHTAASIAISSGASVLAVQRMLGHSSAKVTLDVYSQLFDTDLDALGEKLDGVQRDAVASNLRPMVRLSNFAR